MICNYELIQSDKLFSLQFGLNIISQPPDFDSPFIFIPYLVPLSFEQKCPRNPVRACIDLCQMPLTLVQVNTGLSRDYS